MTYVRVSGSAPLATPPLAAVSRGPVIVIRVAHRRRRRRERLTHPIDVLTESPRELPLRDDLLHELPQDRVRNARPAHEHVEDGHPEARRDRARRLLEHFHERLVP